MYAPRVESPVPQCQDPRLDWQGPISGGRFDRRYFSFSSPLAWSLFAQSTRKILLFLLGDYASIKRFIGERISYVGTVPNKAELEKDPKVRVFHGRGRTLMSGLGDAHTHFTWNGGDLDRLGDLGVEEHVLLTARSAQCYLDSGYTMYVLYTLISTPCGCQAS